MRLAVVGAGAVGGTLAALLDRGGHDVVVTAQGESLEVIRRAGIELSGAWGEYVAHVVASEVLDSTPDIAFVCVKAQDAAAAIESNAARLAGSVVVVVQNGLDGVERARRLLPESRCVGAVAVFAADRWSRGRVTVATPGPLLVGEGGGEPSQAAVQVATVMAQVMPCEAVSNFTGVQWTKLVVNQVNAVPAITGLSAQEVLSDRQLRRIIAASMREVMRTGRALGVRFGSVPGLDHGAVRLLAGPLPVGQLLLLASRRRLGSTPVTGSTLQSIRWGRSTEIDHLTGAVASRAAAVGRSAPVSAVFTELVHEVERTGRFLSPAELVQRVGPVS
ncbi:ketopantoate reductase family protein [Pedococcus sp. NPDC057267]|uniref:ketopantoate reductase family protein n=1 Tax=Pedococcus sp. NPDC057267 TaxID=3346077 RepID=UPI0036431463